METIGENLGVIIAFAAGAFIAKSWGKIRRLFAGEAAASK